MDPIQRCSSETTTHEMLFPLRKASQIKSNSQRCLVFTSQPCLRFSFFFFLCFFSTPPWFWSEHNVVRSDLTPWQFSVFSKSCEDAQQRWTYAAVCVKDHRPVGFLFTGTFPFSLCVSACGDATTETNKVELNFFNCGCYLRTAPLPASVSFQRIADEKHLIPLVAHMILPALFGEIFVSSDWGILTEIKRAFYRTDCAVMWSLAVIAYVWVCRACVTIWKSLSKHIPCEESGSWPTPPMKEWWSEFIPDICPAASVLFPLLSLRCD